jgi:hypothetical protein
LKEEYDIRNIEWKYASFQGNTLIKSILPAKHRFHDSLDILRKRNIKEEAKLRSKIVSNQFQ